MNDNSDSGGCGCSFVFYVMVGLWALSTVVSGTNAVIRSVEQFFCSLVKSAEAWWTSLVHTPYFHLTSVTLASIAIGLLVGWAVAFRTRLPTSGF